MRTDDHRANRVQQSLGDKPIKDMMSSIRWIFIKHTLNGYVPYMPFEDPMVPPNREQESSRGN